MIKITRTYVSGNGANDWKTINQRTDIILIEIVKIYFCGILVYQSKSEMCRLLVLDDFIVFKGGLTERKI